MVGTTALLVAGGIAAAGQAAGAINGARAANKAGKQQEEGARQARGALDQSYNVQMGLMDPYAALGRQSANTLGRLMQPGVAYTPQMQAQDARAFQNAPSPWNMAPPPPVTGQRPSILGQRPAPTPPPVAPPAFMPFAQPQQFGDPRRIPPRRTLSRLMPARAA